jgi:hypothetical protein
LIQDCGVDALLGRPDRKILGRDSAGMSRKAREPLKIGSVIRPALRCLLIGTGVGGVVLGEHAVVGVMTAGVIAIAAALASWDP